MSADRKAALRARLDQNYKDYMDELQRRVFVGMDRRTDQGSGNRGCFRSARMAVQKLCEAARVDLAWSGYDGLAPEEKTAWLNLFAGALMDHVMTAAE